MIHARTPNNWSAAEFVPATSSLSKLRAAAAECQGCPLYLLGTQTVFGAGRKQARLILVGEQPGDEEDRQGEPFVGPAGRLLDEVLAQAEIDRREVYVTNAVKHFKWIARGKRRLHAKPTSREAAACRPWLEAELAAIEPEGIVCLGAIAAQSLLGSSFRITRQHGEVVDYPGEHAQWIMATYHPSAVLRAPDREARAEMRRAMLKDLSAAAKLMH